MMILFRLLYIRLLFGLAWVYYIYAAAKVNITECSHTPSWHKANQKKRHHRHRPLYNVLLDLYANWISFIKRVDSIKAEGLRVLYTFLQSDAEISDFVCIRANRDFRYTAVARMLHN